MKKRFIIAIAIVALISVATLLLAQKRSSAPAELPATEKKSPAVHAEKVSDQHSVSFDFSAPGTVQSESEATITAGVSGTIISSSAELGRFANIGQTLFQIDNTGSRISSEDGFQNSSLQIAELSLSNAKKAYQEAKRAYDRNHSTALKTARDQAQNSRDIAALNYQMLLDQHIVKSPIAGTITLKNVSVGDSVSTGDTLATVSRGKKIIRFYTDDTEHALLTVGQALTFSKETSGKNALAGTIIRISPIADPTSRRFLVEATSQDAGFTAYSSGTVVTVSVSVSRQSAPGTFFLPLSALSQDQNGAAVFVVDGDTARRVTVDIRDIQGETVELSGPDLNEETLIIMTDVKRLKDGDMITHD